MVEAFSSDTAEEALAVSVHQRRLHRGAHDANVGTTGNAIEVASKLVITVTENDNGARAERRDVSQLLCGPLLRRSSGHAHVNDVARVHVDDEEGKDRPEPDVVRLQEIACPHGVVAQEGAPPLAVRGRPRPADVSLNRTLRDADAELEQLASDPLCAPQVPWCTTPFLPHNDGR